MRKSIVFFTLVIFSNAHNRFSEELDRRRKSVLMVHRGQFKDDGMVVGDLIRPDLGYSFSDFKFDEQTCLSKRQIFSNRRKKAKTRRRSKYVRVKDVEKFLCEQDFLIRGILQDFDEFTG